MRARENILAILGSDVPGTNMQFLLLPLLGGTAPAYSSSCCWGAADDGSFFSKSLMAKTNYIGKYANLIYTLGWQ